MSNENTQSPRTLQQSLDDKIKRIVSDKNRYKNCWMITEADDLLSKKPTSLYLKVKQLAEKTTTTSSTSHEWK